MGGRIVTETWRKASVSRMRWCAPLASVTTVGRRGKQSLGRIRARYLTARLPNPPVRPVRETFASYGSRDRDIYGHFHFARIPPRSWCTACAFPGYLCTVFLPYP